MSDEINKDETMQEDIDIPVNGEESSHDVEKEENKKDHLSESVMELPHGDALDMHKTYEITASQKTKLIVIAGSVSSGKTTMITSIYHLLQRGAFAGYIFAGSKTLVGFERRCHSARISSENTTPQTSRTRRGLSNSILHLRLRDNKCQKRSQDLLITDFSGEDYDAVNANVQLAQSEFGFIIKRADAFTLLVDGDAISLEKSWHSTKQQCIIFLKTLRDAGLLGFSSKVDVLISKYDIVKERAASDSTISGFIDSLKKEVESEFSKPFGMIRIFEIAARPDKETEEMGLGYGVDKLIQYWLQPESTRLPDNRLEIKPDELSEFDLFSIHTLGHENGQ